MQVTTKIIAVGKHKPKFNQTGVLISKDGDDTWVDMPGNLSWKDYKDKTFTMNIAQNDKGYWHGTFDGGQAPPQTTQQAPSQPAQRPNDHQDDIRFAQALNLAEADHRHDKIDLCGMKARHDIYYQILKTRQWPAEMQSLPSQFTADNELKPLPEDATDYSDDIAF
jgi:hypothetical protein